ncbi:hypothetical protein EXIGLDRAFT_777980 [Exidia glandulosa HHB12029]|uniref:Uncharacterized protein n=1 Tax=Exidia glandulosa HHB12029 TaxID=1314781 RepID=A0A165CSS3_EXIGL|nr:hypothetical protein EXIGLDRAFT_777980 [Exidia glandulosa HHB12029]
MRNWHLRSGCSSTPALNQHSCRPPSLSPSTTSASGLASGPSRPNTWKMRQTMPEYKSLPYKTTFLSYPDVSHTGVQRPSTRRSSHTTSTRNTRASSHQAPAHFNCWFHQNDQTHVGELCCMSSPQALDGHEAEDFLRPRAEWYNQPLERTASVQISHGG